MLGAEGGQFESDGSSRRIQLLLANIVKCGKCGARFQLQTRLIRDLVDESGILRQKTHEHRRQLPLELRDIERRIERWEEAFESGVMLEETGADRLHTLKAKKAELKTTLSKVVPLRPPPEALQTRAAIRQFQANLKGLFLGGDNGVARNYLRPLIEKIVINGPEVHIHVRGAEAIALMAAPQLTGEAKKETTERVRTTVGGWLQLQDSSRRSTPRASEQPELH